MDVGSIVYFEVSPGLEDFAPSYEFSFFSKSSTSKSSSNVSLEFDSSKMTWGDSSTTRVLLLKTLYALALDA